jgi:hypothetical protein
MFRHSQELITDQETERLNRVRRPSFGKLFGKADTEHDKELRSVDVYQVSVLQCFIPPDFNEELPLYLLDLGGMILVLFGQWMYDPHTLVARKEVFEAWNCAGAFFGNFSLRCLVAQGKVLQLVVGGTDFVEAQRLPSVISYKRLSECQLVPGNSETLIHDLAKGGLIEAE